MAPRTAPEVTEYLAKMPAAARKEIARVREVIRANLPAGYEEAVVRGMLVYQVPLARYPDTYNGHALWYAALAPRKNYLTLYLMSVYGYPPALVELKAGFKAAGKKLDIGKACLRFKAADDLALDAVAGAVAAIPLEKWVAVAQAARRR